MSEGIFNGNLAPVGQMTITMTTENIPDLVFFTRNKLMHDFQAKVYFVLSYSIFYNDDDKP